MKILIRGAFIFLAITLLVITVLDMSTSNVRKTETAALANNAAYQSVKVLANGSYDINNMDMPKEYGLDEDDDLETTPLSVMKDKALKKKSDYIMSIVERMISVGSSGDNTSITPQQRTIVDRCVVRTYAKYLEHDFNEDYLPTLIDLQNELDKERSSEEGRQIAEGIEYYTKGSMDIFAHHTNVAVQNRLVVFNVRDLGEQLKQIALIIVFDFIWNRMINAICFQLFSQGHVH